MILKADEIVYGHIKKLDKSYFYLDDTTSHNRKTIKIMRFHNWACASRYEEYKVGQKVLLFLKKKGDYFYIMSAGGEGEIAIINDSVSFRIADSFSPPYERQEFGPYYIQDSMVKYKFLKGNYNYYSKFKISFLELLSAIKILKQHFIFSNNDEFWCKEFLENSHNALNISISQGSFFELLYKGFIIDGYKYCR